MDRVLSFLGIAQRAGKVQSGGYLTEKAIKAGQAGLVIIASDAGPNTSETIQNKCTFYKVPCCFYGTKEALGHAIGRDERSCVAICDRGIAKSIEKLLSSGKKEE